MIKKLFTFIALLLTATLSFAETLKSSGGDINFTAIGKPGFLKIKGDSKGKFPEGTVKFENGQAEANFTFELNDFTTGISLRDTHMKEKYLETGKHPKVKLTVKDVKIKDSNTDLKGDFKGTLDLHGVSKEVSGTFDYNGSAKKLNAKFSIKVSDFKIDIPKYLGVTVSESVDIETNITLK